MKILAFSYLKGDYSTDFLLSHLTYGAKGKGWPLYRVIKAFVLSTLIIAHFL